MFKSSYKNIYILLINGASLKEICDLLTTNLSGVPKGFFKAQPFVADLNHMQLASSIMPSDLKACFRQYGLTLIGLCNHSFDDDAMLEAGLATFGQGKSFNHRADTEHKPMVSESLPQISPLPNAALETMVVRHHVRSGQRIYAEKCDLVIIGSVSAGAEIFSDGNISVYGYLRGRALAGVRNNREAFIYCNELSAELLSIAGCYQNMEQLEVYKGQKNSFITLNPDETMSVVSLLK